MPKAVLLELKKLKPHEHVQKSRVKELVEILKSEGRFTEPIVVEKNTFVILDGHHRVQALLKLGYTKVPAILIDYNSDGVKVYLRRNNLMTQIIKEFVLKTALAGEMMPIKTTRHEVKRPKIDFLLSALH
jgi:hypothetical protein